MKEEKIDYFRGHEIKEINGQWFYSGTDELVKNGYEEKPCGKCNKKIEEHDPCIKNLIGVINACCGHGEYRCAYLQFENLSIVRGKDAIFLQNILSKLSRNN